jgi:hypothetical protein
MYGYAVLAVLGMGPTRPRGNCYGNFTVEFRSVVQVLSQPLFESSWALCDSSQGVQMSTHPTERARKRNGRSVLEPAESSTSQGPSKFEVVQNVLMAPFSHRKRDSTRILSGCM